MARRPVEPVTTSRSATPWRSSSRAHGWEVAERYADETSTADAVRARRLRAVVDALGSALPEALAAHCPDPTAAAHDVAQRAAADVLDGLRDAGYVLVQAPRPERPERPD